MKNSGEQYRQQLVEQVKAAGEYLSDNAAQLIDGMDLKTRLTIYIDFEQQEVPEISITQQHFMRNVFEVITEQNKKT